MPGASRVLANTGTALCAFQDKGSKQTCLFWILALISCWRPTVACVGNCWVEENSRTLRLAYAHNSIQNAGTHAHKTQDPPHTHVKNTEKLCWFISHFTSAGFLPCIFVLVFFVKIRRLSMFKISAFIWKQGRNLVCGPNSTLHQLTPVSLHLFTFSEKNVLQQSTILNKSNQNYLAVQKSVKVKGGFM